MQSLASAVTKAGGIGIARLLARHLESTGGQAGPPPDQADGHFGVSEK
jgi:hypothetical protein